MCPPESEVRHRLGPVGRRICMRWGVSVAPRGVEGQWLQEIGIGSVRKAATHTVGRWILQNRNAAKSPRTSMRWLGVVSLGGHWELPSL